MMKKFSFLFFLFFISLLSISFVSADVIQIGSISSPIFMPDAFCTSYYISQYFSGWDDVSLQVWDVPMTSQYGDSTNRQRGELPYCLVANKTLSVCLTPLSDDIRLEICTLDILYANNGSYLISIQATNFSTTNALGFSLEVDTFMREGITNQTKSDSFVASWTSSFISLFPSKDNLSTSEKFGFVFIAMLIITGLIYYLVYLSQKKIPSSVHYIIFMLNVALFLFFVSIGYIPVAVLVVLALIIIALGYFRIKSGGK
jgi:hypothetical protein